jgi:predicted acylesterase/phospholipase RssA
MSDKTRARRQRDAPSDELRNAADALSERGDLPRLVDTSTRIGFALSGGGSRGSFAVGALTYLTQVMGVGASVISGTSVGALSALKLAGSVPAQQGQATGELIAQWTALMSDDQMWEWASWLVPLLDAPMLGTDVQDFFEKFLGVSRTRDLYGPLVFRVGSDDPAFEIIAGLIQGPALAPGALMGIGAAAPGALAIAADRVRGVIDAFKSGEASALTNLAPTEELTKNQADLDSIRRNEENRFVQLRLATVSLETGRLRYVTGTGVLLERDNITPVKTVTVGEEDPACKALADELSELMRKPGRLEVDTRLKPYTSYEDSWPDIQAKMRALENCRRQHPPSSVTRAAVVDVIKGAMASAAAPAFFPPVTLEGETYTDGGIRELVPVDVAFRCGATLVYAISCSALDSSQTEVTVPGLVPRTHTGGFNNLINIAARALTELTLDEVGSDDVRGFDDAVSVIAPTFNLHSGLLIDPGLIDIWIDYGLMRASDVAKYPPGIEDLRAVTGKRAMELSDHLTRLRVAVWLAEHVIADAPIAQLAITHGPPGYLPRWQADGPSIPFTNQGDVALNWVRFLRVLERALVDRREQLGLLAGRTPWEFLMNWERHPFSLSGVLWPNSATQLRPAAGPPGRRLIKDMGSGKLFQLLPSGAITTLMAPASASPTGTSSEVSEMPPGLVDALRGA